jgi:hypothetical protein
MSKHILMYEHIGPTLQEALEIIQDSSQISLQEVYGDNIVIETGTPDLKLLMLKLPGWRSTLGRKVHHPDNRVHVSRP